MAIVACTTLDGSTRLFHEKELFLRPAAYAIIIQQGKLLVLRLRHYGIAYHGLHFYYLCCPSSLHLIDDDQVDDFAAERPRWVEIASLHPQDFQMHGDTILTICSGTTND